MKSYSTHEPAASGSLKPSFTEREYRHVHETAGLAAAPIDGYLLRGADRHDLLQRISTNDLRGLRSGECRQTIFTNEKGKFIAFASILVLQDTTLVISDRMDSVVLKEWIERFIIMEDVTISSLSTTWTGYLIGKQAKEILSKECRKLPDESGDNWEFTNGGGWAILDHRWNLPCYSILLKSETGDFAKEFTQRNGIVGDNLLFQTVRIEQGVPWPGLDLTADINPLEAGLEKFISFQKGCYIGQEVIARLDTYRKVKAHLRGVLFDYPEPAGSPGIFKADDGTEAGYLTSDCFSQTIGKRIGMGYIKTASGLTKLHYVNRDNMDGGMVTIIPLDQLPDMARRSS